MASRANTYRITTMRRRYDFSPAQSTRMGVYRSRSPLSPARISPRHSSQAWDSKLRPASFATPMWTEHSCPACASRHCSARACVRQLASGTRREAACTAQAKYLTEMAANWGARFRRASRWSKTHNARKGSSHNPMRTIITRPAACRNSERSPGISRKNWRIRPISGNSSFFAGGGYHARRIGSNRPIVLSRTAAAKMMR